ncbi:MAG: DUF255 domain-containing protein, partial [Rhodopirellula sp.]|nr:DUF255 domain-containing protein [Rhodopirellula sp.]
MVAIVALTSLTGCSRGEPSAISGQPSGTPGNEASLAAFDDIGDQHAASEVIHVSAETVPKNKAEHVNRLAHETSPYLLMHARNPVDWYPWGPEAFEAAKSGDKMIFLSIGYSSCYWCHVMERLVFENEEIARYMNEHFINIKVDRE